MKYIYSSSTINLFLKRRINFFIFQNVQLITSANKHRFIVPGGVKQLTKQEFEAFTNQVPSAGPGYFLIKNDQFI